jgi:hypothetical protein
VPTDTFSVAASGDDGYWDKEGPPTGWPPDGTGGDSGSDSAISMLARKYRTAAFVDLIVALVRFDTSALPDDAVITDATLRLQIISVGNITDRTLNVGYYASANWPISTGDWTGANDPGSDAGTFALTGISVGQEDLVLSSPTSVNVSGYTGLRLGISGGDPGIDDRDYKVEMATLDHSTLTEPQLLVTYTDAGPTAPYVSVSVA